MGDFTRSRSKVWWSTFSEEHESRGSSSSPSSSHKSQDSGFSDSETSPPASVAHSNSISPRLPTLNESASSEHADASSRTHDVVRKCCDGKNNDSRGEILLASSFTQGTRLAIRDSSFDEPPCLDLVEPLHTSTPKASEGDNARQHKTAVKASSRVKPINLLADFNHIGNGSYTEDLNPTQWWLDEMANTYEPECMTALQSKSLAADLNVQVAAMSAETTAAVKSLQEKTRIISSEFAKLVQQLERGTTSHIAPLVQSLVGNIVEFLYDFGNKQKTVENSELLQACDKLRRSASKPVVDQQEVSGHVATLGQSFARVVDTMLTRQIKTLVGVLEAPSTEMALRSALTSLTTLGLDGTHLSSLVTDCGGVRALLAVCLESSASSVRAAALRTLATVCCVAETIRQLEQAGGIEILSEILSEATRPEPEISEAAALLAQITAPWVEDNHSIAGLATHLSSLIQSLTRILSSTGSTETLLLSAAALANLTFMEPQSVWPLIEHCSAGQLLHAVRKQGSEASVFLQEQAATLMANMAAVPESRSHLAEQSAVVALLCFLQIRHSPLQRAPEIAAAERVQQKSAIALSRLCSDPVVAMQVVELQGVSRLVRLCKEERERNHSDGVLVACLAALRKIAANCGTKVMDDSDALELVEPRLLDSFLIYSSRQESYV